MDGELDAHQTDQQCARLNRDEDARATWDTFHLIGDAVRGNCQNSPSLRAQLSTRLAQEPTVLTPRPRPARRIAAYALSAAASLSAVALVGCVAMQEPQTPTAQITVAPPPVQPPVELVSLPSEGQMNASSIAHQEFSPSTAIQGLAPYIRSVSATKGRE